MMPTGSNSPLPLELTLDALSFQTLTLYKAKKQLFNPPTPHYIPPRNFRSPRLDVQIALNAAWNNDVSHGRHSSSKMAGQSHRKGHGAISGYLAVSLTSFCRKDLRGKKMNF